MSQEGERPPARGRPAAALERFPGRRRLRWLLPDTALPPSGEDAVTRAARRLRTLLGSPSEQPVADLGMAAELEALDRRLRRLLEQLSGGGGAPLPAAIPVAAAEPASRSSASDTIVEDLLKRALAYFDEWRLLLLEDGSPAEVLADFASSPYLEQLERHHPRCFLLLDAEGVVLRAAHAERAGEAAPRLGRGSRPIPDDLRGMASTALGGGRLLVRPEPAV